MFPCCHASEGSNAFPKAHLIRSFIRLSLARQDSGQEDMAKGSHEEARRLPISFEGLDFAKDQLPESASGGRVQGTGNWKKSGY